MRRLALVVLLLGGCSAEVQVGGPDGTAVLQEIVDEARRIPNRTGWFEILALPNRVYALWEPGHFDRVNSFFVVGTKQHLLYDTGLGIASIRAAIDDLIREEGLAELPIMVVNSHNHLDHNGGNKEFPEIYTVDDPWARERLTQGLPVGAFTDYWGQMTGHPGVSVPEDFDPATHATPPYPLDRVRFLADGEVIDLGDRSLRVLRTYSHSPDGIALHDEDNELFFGGDAFYGAKYLVIDLPLLAADLARTQHLAVRWHYSSHGTQLVSAMQHGRHLAVVERMQAGEGDESQGEFAGVSLPVLELDGVQVTLAPDVLVY